MQSTCALNLTIEDAPSRPQAPSGQPAYTPHRLHAGERRAGPIAGSTAAQGWTIGPRRESLATDRARGMPMLGIVLGTGVSLVLWTVIGCSTWLYLA